MRPRFNAAPARVATRDHLVHLLWSDLKEESGRHALRHHLWLLKNKLADVVAINRGETLTRREPIPCDRDELNAASREGRRDVPEPEMIAHARPFRQPAMVGAMRHPQGWSRCGMLQHDG